MNKFNLNLNIFILLLLVSHFLKAQVIAEPAETILCDGQQGEVAVTLTATSYAVDLTDSNIYSDDTFGSVIDMGFDFIFYGNSYSDVVLASNNYLSFNTANAGNYSDWTIGAAIPTATEPETHNGILCPWQDIYPGVNGNGIIAYATIGEAPNRVFIASFCGIPMFSCTEICYSSQIKLYETTNIIETHIAQKVLCSTWNGGAAIHGLHNEDGSIAHVVTGLDGIERNFPNAWTCENDAWRFTPNGSTDYIIESIEFAPAVAGTDITWQDEFGNNIGTGSEITVFPGGDVTYTAGASLCGDAGDWCGFEGGIEGDDVIITFEVLEISGDGTNILCNNNNDGTIELFAPYEGDWIYNLYLDGALIESETSSNENFIFNSLSPGTYSATITEQNSLCVSEEYDIVLIQPDELITNSTTIDVLCNGYSEGSIDIQINGGNPPYTTFLGNAINPNIETLTGSIITFENLIAGDYYFTSTDANGCLTASNEFFFTINEPLELSLIEEEIGGVTCEDAQNGFIEITISGGTPPYSYQWSNNTGFNSNEEDLNNLDGGNYIISITDLNNCTYQTNINVLENAGMIIDPLWTECINNDGEITITTNGGTPPYNYELYDINNIETALETNTTGYFNDLNEGQYIVEIIDNVGCLEQETISLNSAPSADFNINEYEFYLSNNPTEFTDLTLDTNISEWFWEFGDGNSSNIQNPTNLYTEPGIYYITLEVYDELNCKSSITKEIMVLQDYYSYAPDIFTPNNDGINDTFSPSLLNIDINSYLLIIYDRWGNAIFETNNYGLGWDGKLKDGTLLNPDIYSYHITYNTNLGIAKEEKGRLVMAR